MKNMLGNLLKGLVNEKQTRVGKVDVSLAQALKINKQRHDAMHKEIKQKIEAYIEQLEKEHKPFCDSFTAEKTEIWESIYERLGLSQAERDENYRVSSTTGIVHKIEIEPMFDMDDADENNPIH